jgi:hypothetical protein
MGGISADEEKDEAFEGDQVDPPTLLLLSYPFSFSSPALVTSFAPPSPPPTVVLTLPFEVV